MAEIKCPCGLRNYMEEEDCKKTTCNACCPLTKPQTNAQKIRAMSDEELKEFICSNSQCKFCKFEGWGRCELLEWLQQPVKENDYD